MRLAISLSRYLAISLSRYLAISLGGDSDTIACMAGAIAHAFYREIPDYIIEISRGHLTRDLEPILDEFIDKYIS